MSVPRTLFLWLSTIRRLLLLVEGLQHGGSLLVTNDRRAGLRVGTATEHESLGLAFLLTSITDAKQAEVVFEAIEVAPGPVDIETAIRWATSPYSHVEALQALEAAMWLVATLTKADGLVVMSHNLTVHS